jgi:hypothetical protein
MATPPLTAERWSQIESIFFEAVAADESACTELLRRRCGGDTALLAEVTAPLSASRREKEARAAAPGSVAPDASASSAVPPGKRFGPWEIDRPLAHGGMGTVYLAHRADGQFEQTVALKLLGAHLSSEFFVARFVTERQILANLTHPNITRLLDGGITPEGIPFLVMEYVEGEPIDRYCDGRRLPIAERLPIFLQVCSAVEYAHRSLVIHRDLKPGNILVTADGSPKLLDFGTAKLLTPDDADQTLTGVAMMTPRYASPEQLRGAAVTTLSDVYSLGIVLYELLTRQSPFGKTESLVSGVERAERPRSRAAQDRRHRGRSRSPFHQLRPARTAAGGRPRYHRSQGHAGRPRTALRFGGAVVPRRGTVSCRRARADASANFELPARKIHTAQQSAGRGGGAADRRGRGRRRRHTLASPSGARRAGTRRTPVCGCAPAG